MKFSELWLREWINPSVDNDSLVNRITMSGLKVNTVEPASLCFTGVVIGEIIDIQQHPNHCNLWINTINTGSYGIFNIVSRAKKYKKNIRVAVAIVGANLPDNFKIKCIRIQGVLSEGMLCTFKSLGIVYNHNDIDNHIIELPLDAPIGEDLKKYLQLNDNIIDVAITPNRGDCLNMIGIAHDIAAMYRLSIKSLKIDYIKPMLNDVLPISVDVPEACPCYFGRILKNIDISISTPLWIKEKLRRSGIQITHVVEDVIHYVLLELGQPIHVFDLDNISGGINVRFATHGEIITGKDNHKIMLRADTLIIADQRCPLEIAGISFRDHTVIINVLKTSNIFLGSAFFYPIYVTRAVKQYKTTNYFSQRYEHNGVNPEISKLALERVTSLLITICGGISSEIVTVINKNMLPKRITIILHRNKLDKLLGCIIPDQEVIDILTYLGCNIQINKDGGHFWKVLVPIWRFDITMEEDLIEEVIRLHGYDKIKKISKYNALKVITSNDDIFSLSRIKTLLVDRGYQEIITYSFVNPEMQNLLFPNNNPVILLNPLTVDMSAMRLSLLVGLVKTLLYNQNRQHKNIRLFECGRCFTFDEQHTTQIHQDLMLSGIMTGLQHDDHWDITPHCLDFYDIKGDIESLLEIIGQLNYIEFKSKIYPALHPGQSAAIFLKGEYVGYIGVIHPVLVKKLNLQTRTCVFELFWGKISQYKMQLKIFDIPKFPINRRDISIIVSKNISVGEVIFECKKTIKNCLIDIKLFDVYQGHGIPHGFKSLSISLYISHNLYTLQEKEIEFIVSQCVSVLKERFQATLREK